MSFNPYHALGIHVHSTPEEIEDAWMSSDQNTTQGTAYQLLMDKKYRNLYDSTSWEQTIASGFITSSLDPHLSLAQDVPLEQSILDLAGSSTRLTRPNATVLLMTGAFDPAHSGHINAMERARAHAEKRGQHVIMGILSPTHQDYVSTKRNDAGEALSRIGSCRSATKNHSWIKVSAWESLHALTYHNFTTVIDYHLAVLSEIMTVPHITYVFGEDNKDFSLVFTNENDWICVQRPQTRILSKLPVNLVPNTYAMSSTWIREKSTYALSH